MQIRRCERYQKPACPEVRRDLRGKDRSSQERILAPVLTPKGSIDPTRDVSADAMRRVSEVVNHALSMSTYPPNKVQHTIMTVAREPRLDGDRKPNRAKTVER